ncbi:hypothetical protein Nepgr_018498 [Nepenthes gracilis]|uniref:Uncharacterized protein n=1 Tax=Nepenthes gracilis TaxID=150966 RepID=A0AAD3ST76_NEPGR|nr:hypothetical protein Nepgr_018498 [Nepenthes gracilis]
MGQATVALPEYLRLLQPQAIDVWPKKLQPFDGNGQELNPLDDRTRDLGPLESKTQVDLESSTDLEVPQESECVHLEAHGGTEISNSKFTNKTNVAVENGHHEPMDRNQVEEPPTPHKLEGLSTNGVCEASASTTDLPANGDHAYEDACNIREDEIAVENGHHEPMDCLSS